MSNVIRIPLTIDKFNPYIRNTNSYFLAGTPTNAVRLGLTPDEVTKWTSFETKWDTLYSKYSDKKGSRTTSIIDKLNAIITNCRTFNKSNNILNRIASSPNVTIDDLELFGIKKGELGKTSRSILTSSITEMVLPKLHPIGGGSISVKCFVAAGKTAHIIEGANSVQYTYILGSIAPTSAQVTGLVKELSTKARFTLALGAENAEKHLYIFFRWYNTKYPSLAGPWTTVQTTMIL
jgi:hypothetical protein